MFLYDPNPLCYIMGMRKKTINGKLTLLIQRQKVQIVAGNSDFCLSFGAWISIEKIFTNFMN